MKETKSRKGNARSFLAEWAIKNNISQTSIEELTSGLQKCSNLILPKSAKTLLKTPSNIQHTKTDVFTYCHIGIKESLMAYCNVLQKNGISLPGLIELDFNIDGVKYSRSTTHSLWLIQMTIINSKERFDPFVIGVYFSEIKPHHSFILEFINELKVLVTHGLTLGSTTIPVSIGSFINDTPANSFIRCTKGHAGYSSCIKCTQRGLRLDNCLVFPPTLSTCKLRTNDDFRAKTDGEHHHRSETSFIERIDDLDMVTKFPIDQMHIVQ